MALQFFLSLNLRFYLPNSRFGQSDLNIEDCAETTDKFFNDNGKWRILPSSWDIDPVEAYEQKEFMNAFYECLSDKN